MFPNRSTVGIPAAEVEITGKTQSTTVQACHFAFQEFLEEILQADWSFTVFAFKRTSYLLPCLGNTS